MKILHTFYIFRKNLLILQGQTIYVDKKFFFKVCMCLDNDASTDVEEVIVWNSVYICYNYITYMIFNQTIDDDLKFDEFKGYGNKFQVQNN